MQKVAPKPVNSTHLGTVLPVWKIHPTHIILETLDRLEVTRVLPGKIIHARLKMATSMQKAIGCDTCPGSKHDPRMEPCAANRKKASHRIVEKARKGFTVVSILDHKTILGKNLVFVETTSLKNNRKSANVIMAPFGKKITE